MQFLVADQQFLDIAIVGTEPVFILNDSWSIPVIVFGPDLQNHLGPFLHGDVLAVSVDVLFTN
jgi:hypothetical protein